MNPKNNHRHAIAFAIASISFATSLVPTLAIAGLSVTPAPVPILQEEAAPVTLPIRAGKVETSPVAPIPAKPVKVAPNWIASLPSGASEMCFAGVCLGDSVDQLPGISANGFTVKTPGRWNVEAGGPLTGTDLDHAKRTDEDAQAFEAMKNLNRICAMPASSDPLKSRMRLVFTPNDASAEGLELVAEILPKKAPSTSSSYAVTKIRMTMRQVPADMAPEWAAQVNKLWPGLTPLIAEESKWLPDHYLQWSARGEAPKGLRDASKGEVIYTVEPEVAVSDDEFNATRWENKVVTHELTWSHGLSRAMKAALAAQADCL